MSDFTFSFSFRRRFFRLVLLHKHHGDDYARDQDHARNGDEDLDQQQIVRGFVEDDRDIAELDT